MPTQDYDLIIIGGGIAGAALAAAGARTLILDAETTFHDRVRGVAKARRMGLLDAMTQTGANPLPFRDSYQGAGRSGHRDLTRTTQVKEPAALVRYHPALLNHAESRGDEVRRTAPGPRISPGPAQMRGSAPK